MKLKKSKLKYLIISDTLYLIGWVFDQIIQVRLKSEKIRIYEKQIYTKARCTGGA